MKPDIKCDIQYDSFRRKPPERGNVERQKMGVAVVSAGGRPWQLPGTKLWRWFECFRMRWWQSLYNTKYWQSLECTLHLPRLGCASYSTDWPWTHKVVDYDLELLSLFYPQVPGYCKCAPPHLVLFITEDQPRPSCASSARPCPQQNNLKCQMAPKLRQPGWCSQDPHGGSEPSVPPAPGELAPSSDMDTKHTYCIANMQADALIKYNK